MTLAVLRGRRHPRRGRAPPGSPRRTSTTSGAASPGPGRAPNCIVAANFAIGAVLMMRFAELAAPWFDGAEIIELHHEGKLDAPSGTALRTAERIAGALGDGTDGAARRRGAEVTRPTAPCIVVLDGARGGAGPGGVRLHSVRLPGFVAHQEVVFGADGPDTDHPSRLDDRASFMDGVMLAVESVADRPGSDPRPRAPARL